MECVNGIDIACLLYLPLSYMFNITNKSMEGFHKSVFATKVFTDWVQSDYISNVSQDIFLYATR